MDQEQRQQLVEQGKAIKERLAELEARVDACEAALQREGQKLPNSSHPEVRPSLASKYGYGDDQSYS